MPKASILKAKAEEYYRRLAFTPVTGGWKPVVSLGPDIRTEY